MADDKEKGLKRSISLGELITTLIGIVTLISIWAINLDAKVKENSLRIQYLERSLDATKDDIRDIKHTTQEILIKLESKEDRD